MRNTRKILLLDSRNSFLNDIESRMLLMELDNVDIEGSSDFDNVSSKIKEEGFAEVVFSMDCYDNFTDLDFMKEVETASYARKAQEIQESVDRGIPSYGKITTSKPLIEAIKKHEFLAVAEKKPKQEEIPVSKESRRPSDAKEKTGGFQEFSDSLFDDDFVPEEKPVPQRNYREPETPAIKKKTSLEQERKESRKAAWEEDDYFEKKVVSAPKVTPKPDPKPEKHNWEDADLFDDGYESAPEIPVEPEKNIQQTAEKKHSWENDDYFDDNPKKSSQNPPRNKHEYSWEEEEDYTEEKETLPVRKEKRNKHEWEKDIFPDEEEDVPAWNEDNFDKEKKMPSNEIRSTAKKREQDQEKRDQSQRMKKIKEEVDRDLNIKKGPAKVITINSAKGGVGKTTIACELATVLALTEYGRGRLKVCLVDYNIDFGDVLTTLEFNPQKVLMTEWSRDIRERLDAGAENVEYSKDEIYRYLQYKEESGLYALLAPKENEDSMLIGEDELDIMLENLRLYGGFDFIICDTGNNTRDSTVIAIEKSDQVLLVLTQNVNTVNCNHNFLLTMEKYSFDMNKFAIVINQVKPAKQVGIATEEIKEIFRNPTTKKKYPCIAEIKYSVDVQSATNHAESMAYDSSHEFTKSIRNISSTLIGEHHVIEEPEKKMNLFSFLRRK